MSKAFDTVNIHTLTKKLLDTQIPPILIKFIANYIKGRKAFTTYNSVSQSFLPMPHFFHTKNLAPHQHTNKHNQNENFKINGNLLIIYMEILYMEK